MSDGSNLNHRDFRTRRKDRVKPKQGNEWGRDERVNPSDDVSMRLETMKYCFPDYHLDLLTTSSPTTNRLDPTPMTSSYPTSPSLSPSSVSPNLDDPKSKLGSKLEQQDPPPPNLDPKASRTRTQTPLKGDGPTPSLAFSSLQHPLAPGTFCV